LNGVQEAAGSIPVTRTFEKKHLLLQVLFLMSFFGNSKY